MAFDDRGATQVKRLIIPLLVLLALLVPSAVSAGHSGPTSGMIVRVDGDVVVGANENVGAIVVVDGNVELAGTAEVVVVINGTATLSGAHVHDLVVISGTANLEAGTIIYDDVRLIDSDLNRDAEATVRGSIRRDASFGFRFGVALGVISVVAYASVALAALLAGLGAAAVASRQLRGAADALRREVGPMLLATLVLWVALPVAAVLAFVSVVGIATGIGIVLFVAPALWFIGYLVAGLAIGDGILGATGREQGGRPYAAVTLGLVILLVLGFVPALGAIVTSIAGIVGAGAIALVTWRSLRGSGAQTAPSPQP